MDLRGKVAIVTGASRGVGAALTHALVRQGCSVACAARSTADVPQRTPGTLDDTVASANEVAVDGAPVIETDEEIFDMDDGLVCGTVRGDLIRVLTGLLAEDSKERVVLRLQGGKQEIIPRGDVDEMKVSPLSLMPEDIEKQLTRDEWADLFAFLEFDKPPSDPSAKRLPGTPAPKAKAGR